VLRGRPTTVGTDGDALPATAGARRSASIVASPTTPRSRNNFDGLRLIAALLVLYGHQTADATGTVGLRLLMFFAIGGFLVTGSWLSDPHLPRFLVRRFLRVWPAFAVLIVCCATISWLFPARDMPAISRMASAVYLTNLWAPGFDWGFFPLHDPMMNSSIWMLPYEFDMYLAFALVALLGRGPRIVAGAVLLAIAIPAPQTMQAQGGLFECWSPYFAGFFAFGVLLRELPRLRDGAFVACSVVVGAALLWAGVRTAGLLLVIPPAAVWIGLRSWPVLRSAARFGDLSYGIFLWSWPIQQVTRLWLQDGLPVSIQLAVVLAQVIPIAWLSWRFIEAPALRRKPSVGGTRPRALPLPLAAFDARLRGAPARIGEWLAGLVPTPFR
jgi:peptidoglycan/LPS O-acetylase OafA/YrhL